MKIVITTFPFRIITQENLKYNAVLLSGLPGIGKTTSARLIPKSLGFTTIEQNASDMRNSSSITEHLTSLGNNTVFSNNWEALSRIKGNSRPGNTAQKTIKMKINKCAIIMDEVDGMTSDRGGTKTLIQFIKNAKQPIICICNDRNHAKIRSLASHCLDLQFKQPSLFDVKKLLKRVQATVNMYREDDAPRFELPDDHTLQVITETCKGDIRQILNHIQLWYKNLGTKSVKGITQKDLDNSLNINDAAIVLLNSYQFVKPVPQKKFKSNPHNVALLRKLVGLTFVDYDLLPFFFFENYSMLPGGTSFGRQSFMARKFGSTTDFSICGFKPTK